MCSNHEDIIDEPPLNERLEWRVVRCWTKSCSLLESFWWDHKYFQQEVICLGECSENSGRHRYHPYEQLFVQQRTLFAKTRNRGTRMVPSYANLFMGKFEQQGHWELFTQAVRSIPRNPSTARTEICQDPVVKETWSLWAQCGNPPMVYLLSEE